MKFAATKNFTDENGEPLEWEIRPITIKEDEQIRADCTRDVPVTGKPHLFRPKMDAEQYIAKLMAASVVFPDLLNMELQDSYGVRDPEDLLREMVDCLGEYNKFGTFIQKYNGFDVSMEEKSKEVKN